ncbi:transmembrane protein 26-like [Erpetoichthys calabaricus]|uniref:transmembrane protein 26-like n=1 Tax=Erpetoichthys calabaricus TaxID=27687 RepID=UPI002234B839|nr:transmembrane protein 26-like [Erpetoichthys calabaricus]
MSLKIFHAFLSRLLFFSHGLVAVWHVVTRMQNPMYWGLMTGVITLGIEGFITVRSTEKGEWKWFSPMIFLYLCTIISCIWILELGLLTEEPHICNSSKSHVEHHGLFPLQKLKSLNEETWVAGIEQSMMLVLVIGRWLMPSAGMTSEQLYQLLLMDSGLGADMLDLIDAFKESGVEISRNVRIIGLSVFSWSLMQFPLALTQANYPQDSNSNEDASVHVTDKQSVVSRTRKFFKSCMSGEMWSLFIIIGMQDGPSLVFRMYLLIQEKVRSQMMIFFIGKHFISIVFEVYRIFTVIHVINEQEDSQLTSKNSECYYFFYFFVKMHFIFFW